MTEEQNEEEQKRDRPIMLVCGHCKHHEIDGKTLLEIDFSRGHMRYVCRSCNNDNVIKLNIPPSSLPKMGVM